MSLPLASLNRLNKSILNHLRFHSYPRSMMMDDLRKEIELPEGILVTNIFIPTAIVCSKVDLIEHGEKDIK